MLQIARQAQFYSTASNTKKRAAQEGRPKSREEMPEGHHEARGQPANIAVHELVCHVPDCKGLAASLADLSAAVARMPAGRLSIQSFVAEARHEKKDQHPGRGTQHCEAERRRIATGDLI